MDKKEVRSELTRFVLDSLINEYKELADTWKTLDTKAQGTGTIAGVFLAAIFTWSRDLPAGFTCANKFGLGVALLFLIVVVLLSLFALAVREHDDLPQGRSVKGMYSDLNDVDLQQEHFDRFLGGLIEKWGQTNEQISAHNIAKGLYVRWAQYILVIAMGVVVMVCLASIFK